MGSSKTDLNLGNNHLSLKAARPNVIATITICPLKAVTVSDQHGELLKSNVHTWYAFGSASMLAPRMVLLRLIMAEAEDATPGGSGTTPMSGAISDTWWWERSIFMKNKPCTSNVRPAAISACLYWL